MNVFSYNGLGLRMGKTDSTGQFALVTDGTSPGSPVLSDGHTTFTAGLSSTVAGLSSFRHEDLLGSLRFLTNSSQSVTGSGLFEAFGAGVGATGYNVAFGWVGGADCQTEADTGLVLMGYRYYDSRVGRFISQDPAGDGDNWYAYCDNDPINATDPSGLSMIYDPSMSGASYTGQNDWGSFRNGDWGTYDFFASDGKGGMKYQGTTTLGPSLMDSFMSGGMGLNMGHGAIFANGPNRTPINPEEDRGHREGNNWDKHSRPRSGDKGNQNFGKRGYPKTPPTKRELARQLEQEAQKQARDAARAERDAEFAAERNALRTEAAENAVALEEAEAAVAVDEILIAIGIAAE